MSGRLFEKEGREHSCLIPRAARRQKPSQPPIDHSRYGGSIAIGSNGTGQGLKRRKWAIQDLHESFLASADDFAALLAEECGRPAGEAWTSEIVANHHLFKYWLGHIDDLLTAFPIGLSPIDYPGKRGRVVMEPKGVIGLITPWNLPVAIPLRAMIPALLSGNSIVLKPSEHTPRIGALLGQLCDRHLPPGVVQIIQGGGAQGAATVDAKLDQIFFTGSVRTGRQVAASAATRIKGRTRCGGKDAALVMEDAEIERAAAGITWAAFGFDGQNCVVERCYVHESIFPAFRTIHRSDKGPAALIDLGPLMQKHNCMSTARD